MPTGVIVLIINIPLFVLGFRYAGGMRFAIRTAYATVLMSALTDLFVPWIATIPPITQPLLFTLYGGLLDGIGMGLVFRGQGTSPAPPMLVARPPNRRRGVPLGQTILAVNSAVLILAVIVFGLEPAMYALILTFVGARVVDVVQGEADYNRTAIIISAQAHEIKAAILGEMERGVTLWSGRGWLHRTRPRGGVLRGAHRSQHLEAADPVDRSVRLRRDRRCQRSAGRGV